MALKLEWSEGFDGVTQSSGTGSNPTLSRYGYTADVGYQAQIVGNTPQSQGQAWEVLNAGFSNTFLEWQSTNLVQPEVWVFSCWIYTNGPPQVTPGSNNGQNQMIVLFDGASGAVCCSLMINYQGQPSSTDPQEFQLSIGGAAGKPYGTTIVHTEIVPANAWYNVQLRIVKSTGLLEWFLNGTSVYSANTAPASGGGDHWSTWLFAKWQDLTNYAYIIDHVAIFSSSTTADTVPAGNGFQVQTLQPGAFISGDWVPTVNYPVAGGPPNNALFNVNEFPGALHPGTLDAPASYNSSPDQGDDYVDSQDSANPMIYTMNPWNYGTLAPNGVKGVALTIFWQVNNLFPLTTTPGSGIVGTFGGVTAPINQDMYYQTGAGTRFTVAGGPGRIHAMTSIFPVNPVTGLSWTAGDVLAGQWGFKQANTPHTNSNWALVQQIYLEVVTPSDAQAATTKTLSGAFQIAAAAPAPPTPTAPTVVCNPLGTIFIN